GQQEHSLPNARLPTSHLTSRSMPAFRPPREPAGPALLGPQGPFPRTALVDPIERRWLHYAFLSRDRQLGLVANAAWLGADRGGEGTHFTTIVLLHERGEPWVARQFSAAISEPPWSAFRLPTSLDRDARLHLAAAAGEPAVDLRLRRTGTPCTSQCAPFA